MGYLLKIEEKVKMYYSKPEYGCYANDIMLVNRKEYDEHYSQQENDAFVFIEGWHDTTAELHSKESLGIDVTDSFYLDCILQGKKLQENELHEFGLYVL